MTDIEGEELAADLGAAVRDVAGVTGLFHVGGILSKVADAGRRSSASREPGRRRCALTQLRTTGGSRSPSASTAPRGRWRPAAVCTRRSTRSARRAARGVPLAKVQVTVAHVDESTMRGVAG